MGHSGFRNKNAKSEGAGTLRSLLEFLFPKFEMIHDESVTDVVSYTLAGDKELKTWLQKKMSKEKVRNIRCTSCSFARENVIFMKQESVGLPDSVDAPEKNPQAWRFLHQTCFMNVLRNLCVN